MEEAAKGETVIIVQRLPVQSRERAVGTTLQTGLAAKGRPLELFSLEILQYP
jgi:hypothetical protein